MEKKKYPIMPDINITNHGISKLLSNLDSSKAAGSDELKPKFLKELAPNISPILCLIFNKSLELSLLIGALHMLHPFTRKGLSILPKTIDLYHLHVYAVKYWDML